MIVVCSAVPSLSFHIFFVQYVTFTPGKVALLTAVTFDNSGYIFIVNDFYMVANNVMTT